MKEFLHKQIQLFLKSRNLQIAGLAIICLVVFVCVIMLITYGASYGKKNGNVVLSEKTVNDLVDKAANQKYIQKVFNAPAGFKALPVPKKTEAAFKEPPEEMFSGRSGAKEVVAQRCMYNGQSYVAGDIVKTDGGWVKCTPTVVFVVGEDKDKSIVRQSGGSVWTVVQ